jgi:LysM repeat protein
MGKTLRLEVVLIIFLYFGGSSMQWKDSNNRERLGNDEARDFLDEDDNASWDRTDNARHLTHLNDQLKKYAPVLIGVALFLVAIGGLRLLFSGGSSGNDNRVRLLEERIQNLEDTYKKFESIDSKVTRIWEQAKSFENFKNRFDRTEASMSLRMDHLASNIDAVKKQLRTTDSFSKSTHSIIESAQKKTPVKRAAKSRSVRYHTVTAKETLYGISVKYGIKLENLLEMNHLRKDAIIQPGQKLIVKK